MQSHLDDAVESSGKNCAVLRISHAVASSPAVDEEEKKDSDRGIGQVKFGTKTTQPRANMLKKSKRSLSKGEDKGQVVKGAQLLQRR